MKKLVVLFSLVCCMVFTAVPVFASDTSESTSETTSSSTSTDDDSQSASDMKDAFDEYGGKLSDVIDEVKQGWDDVFSGLEGVLKFLADTVGGIFGVLPASYTVYVVMLCLCIAVSAVIQVLTE